MATTRSFSIAALASLALSTTAFAQTQEASLEASDAQTQDYMGQAVAVSGDYAVLGAPKDDDRGVAAGAAYVFLRSGGVWSQVVKLRASDGAAGDEFGGAVGIDGDTLVVGAKLDDVSGLGPGAAGINKDWGSAYVFVRSGTTWVQQAKLLAADREPRDHFGSSVGISGNTVAIGAETSAGISTSTGAAYVFTRTGTMWSQQAKIRASNGVGLDYFGFSIAIDGDWVVVGATNADAAGSSSGSAYVFERNGTNWTQRQELLPAGLSASDKLGWSVAIDGGRLVVGASNGDGAVAGSGAAYVYTQGPGTWAEEAKLQAADGVAGDKFGSSVGISGDRAIAGASWDSPAGSGYLFARAGTAWNQVAKVVDIGRGAGDQFGASGSLDGSTALFGAPRTDVGAIVDAGRGVVFSFDEPFVKYCASNPNSTGSPASISGSGSSSIAANDLSLTAGPGPNEFGIFFFGATQIQVPFGEGFLCVGGALFRFPITAAVGGEWSQDVDYTIAPAAGQITSGSTWNFQCWFRDPTGGPSGFNTSNGLEITFVP